MDDYGNAEVFLYCDTQIFHTRAKPGNSASNVIFPRLA